MNCKQGDLAVFVRSEAGNLGRIVRCVRFIGFHSWLSKDGGYRMVGTWEVDRKLPNFDGVFDLEAPDDQLRPIRDPGDDATDETLTWLDVPTKQGETA